MLLGDRLAEHPEHPLQLLFVYIFGGDRIPQPADNRFIHSSSRVSHNVFQKFHRPAEVKFLPDFTVQPREAKRLVAHRDLSEFARTHSALHRPLRVSAIARRRSMTAVAVGTLSRGVQ